MKIYGLILLSLFLLCCNSNTDSSKNVIKSSPDILRYVHLSVEGEIKLNFDSLQYPIDTTGWIVMVSTESEKDLYFSMIKEENDTSKHITFFSDKNLNFMKLDSYTKEFYDKSDKHVVAMHEDTFYYYVEDRNLTKHFIIGEYNYRFALGKLDVDEMDYYILYRDSLGKIKGNNLPNLPKANQKEIELIRLKDRLKML